MDLISYFESFHSVHYIPPKGEFILFNSEVDYENKLKEWGLISKTVKRDFWYRNENTEQIVNVIGYEEYKNNFNVLVVEFACGQLSCIHPVLLKEMQNKDYGKSEKEGMS